MYMHWKFPGSLRDTQNVRRLNNHENTSKAMELNQLLPDTLQRAMDLASEKGASSWLTALPLSEHGFTLHKGAFQDALALRYGWNPTNTSSNCDCVAEISLLNMLYHVPKEVSRLSGTTR